MLLFFTVFFVFHIWLHRFLFSIPSSKYILIANKYMNVVLKMMTVFFSFICYLLKFRAVYFSRHYFWSDILVYCTFQMGHNFLILTACDFYPFIGSNNNGNLQSWYSAGSMWSLGIIFSSYGLQKQNQIMGMNYKSCG